MTKRYFYPYHYVLCMFSCAFILQLQLMNTSYPFKNLQRILLYLWLSYFMYNYIIIMIYNDIAHYPRISRNIGKPNGSI